MIPVMPLGFLGGGKSPLTMAAVSSGTNPTGFNVNLGTGAPDLFVLYVIGQDVTNGSPTCPTSVTVGGVSLTKVADHTYQYDRVSYWLGKVVAGGATVPVVASGYSGTGLTNVVTVYTLRGSPTTSFNSGAYDGTRSGSLNINLPAGGAIAAAAETGGTATWGGSTKGYEYSFSSYALSHARYSAVPPETPHTITCSGSTVFLLSAASFKP